MLAQANIPLATSTTSLHQGPHTEPSLRQLRAHTQHHHNNNNQQRHLTTATQQQPPPLSAHHRSELSLERSLSSGGGVSDRHERSASPCAASCFVRSALDLAAAPAAAFPHEQPPPPPSYSEQQSFDTNFLDPRQDGVKHWVAAAAASAEATATATHAVE
jgi:hypothetical protein